jgi:hypothetical protein
MFHESIEEIEFDGVYFVDSSPITYFNFVINSYKLKVTTSPITAHSNLELSFSDSTYTNCIHTFS